MASDERRLLSAKRLCAGRTMRREEFPEELFGDYSWSMLMLAYIARLENHQLDRGELLTKVGVLPSVGHRWLAFLAEENLVIGDEVVELTDSAAERIERYVDRVIDIAGGQAPI